MKQYVTDTMALVSYIGKRKLPLSIKQIFQQVDLGLVQIFIPSIVLLEIAYLSEKKRIDISLTDVLTHFSNFSSYIEQPLDAQIISESFKIIDIPELHDRVIAGTAKLLNLELISNDPKIEASTFVNTIW